MFKRPIVVNLIAAPGTGKSTIAAGIFEKLKWNNVNAELVTEFAKDKVWEENPAPFKDGGQLYLLGKQFYRMHRCRENVDVIVTDSPLCLASYYLRQIHDPHVITDVKSFDNIVKNLIDSFDNMNFFLNRKKKYNPKGRFQTEEESDKIALELWDFFTDNKDCNYTVSMEKLDGTTETRDLIVEKVLKKLGTTEESDKKKVTGYALSAGTGERQSNISPDLELCQKAKHIPYAQFIRWLRSQMLPRPSTMSNIIHPDEELRCLFSTAKWPANAEPSNVEGYTFVYSLSSTFNLALDLDELNKCKTVKDLANYIDSLCKAQH